MNIGSRYKLLGKCRRATVDLPIDEVGDTFENALCNSDTSRLLGSVNSNTGVFKIEYKIDEQKDDTYENYCMLVELHKTADNGTKIEYAFVYDRLLSWYTKLLSVICFLVPLAAALIIYFEFALKEPKHLLVYIPLLLISAFGIFSLFGYKEKKSSVKPMVKEFERLLTEAFGE